MWESFINDVTLEKVGGKGIKAIHMFKIQSMCDIEGLNCFKFSKNIELILKQGLRGGHP